MASRRARDKQMAIVDRAAELVNSVELVHCVQLERGATCAFLATCNSDTATFLGTSNKFVQL